MIEKNNDKIEEKYNIEMTKNGKFNICIKI